MRINNITFVQRKRKIRLGTLLMTVIIALLIAILGLITYLSYTGWSLGHLGR